MNSALVWEEVGRRRSSANRFVCGFRVPGGGVSFWQQFARGELVMVFLGAGFATGVALQRLLVLHNRSKQLGASERQIRPFDR